ncbi:MAG: heavy metal translocating P-type ATPase metal-binding domain-containing protein [Bacteroidota bacterium]
MLTLERATPQQSVQTGCCTHCGEEIPNEDFQLDGQLFCCQGCMMVFQILQENGLSNFYDIDPKAAFSLKGQSKETFEYLDDPDVRKKFIDFSDGKMARVHFSLPQIHCASCVWLLEQLGRLDERVYRSQVNFLRKEVHITFDEKRLPLSKLATLLSRIGYKPLIRLADTTTTKVATDRSLAIKIGVTGFLFGNIMLFSFPEYLGLEVGADTLLKKYFSYFNLILGLPLLLFSGWSYLQSAYLGLKQRQLNIDLPISIGILALFGRSAFEILSQSGAGYFDSLAGLLFFLLLGKWFQQRTYHQLSFDRDYKSYFPLAATLIRPNGTEQVALDRLDTGDRVLVRSGELIPADGILGKGAARIDYSFVTGESDPVEVAEGAEVFAGGRQTGAAIEVVLTKKTDQSYLIQLWNEKVFTHKGDSLRMGRLADQAGRSFTILILLIAFSTLAFWLWTNPALAMDAFTAVLIIACPCAVALAIPFTFGNVLRLLARKGIVLKNTDSLEALQSVTHIVFDKTGTLTEKQKGEVVFTTELTEESRSWIRSLVHHSAHPKSRKIEIQMGAGKRLEVVDFRELTGKGIEGIIDGHKIQIGSSTFTNQPKEQEGTHVCIDGQLLGSFQTRSIIREGLGELLSSLRTDHKISLLSGDDEREADRFRALFGTEAQLLFRRNPTEKLRFIERLQAKGEVVLMVGDGLNDAGALKQADVGLVVTDDSNDFTPAADVIAKGHELTALARVIRYARASRKLVYAAFGIALLYNLVGLSYAVQALLSPVVAAILMPLSSLTIVLFGVGASSLLAYRMIKISSEINKSHK